MESIIKGENLNSFDNVTAINPCNGYVCNSYIIDECPIVCYIVQFPWN